MRLEDIQCSGCRLQTDDTAEIRSRSPSEADKMVIVQCLDCDHHYCADCLLGHQIDKSTHRIVSLSTTDEINNNEHVPKAEKRQDSDVDDEQKQQELKEQQLKSIEALRQLIEMKQQQQQQNTSNPRLVQIEADINKTFAFYEQTLRERKEYLLKEMNTITQYALLSHSQNLAKQLQVQYQLDMKKQAIEKELQMDYETYSQYGKQIEQLRQEIDAESESTDEMSTSLSVLSEMTAKIEMDVKAKLTALKDLNQLLSINNQLIEKCKATDPLASVEFISNYSAIQTSIRNTFGYIRINQQQQPSSFAKYKQPSSHNLLTNEPSVVIDKPNEIIESAPIQSPVSSYMRKTASSSSLSAQTVDCEDQPDSLLETIKNVLSNNFGADAVAQYLSSLQQQQINESSDAINQSIVQNELATAANENLVQLSAGSTTSNKSSKSVGSNTSLSSSSKSSSQSSAALAATQSKHPLSHLYANFINNNPKLNTFNYLVNDDEHHSSHHHKISRYMSKNHLSSNNGLLTTASTSPAAMLSKSSQSSSSSSSSSSSTHQLQLNRSKMIYHCKFGEFGINDGQFTEPSGVTINTNNDIIVADTNSHRIQIFDKDGNFKFKFGECGKRDGQLLYPNRVSIVKQTGDIVVTERSPTHQIQIYNKYGQFIRKFGANILQHPRGVYVDYKARIVVVECKVMRVIIFDLYGNVLNKFNCSKYLEFPNGVCCSNPTNPGSNQREEIYISDNRAHCIKVFDYNGNFLRQIGAEGITNYPIGVGINANNEILVADNHNNFNLTVFTQEGKLINALESKVKHAQCFDVGLMDDGSIVLASKDYRIYVYKYTNTLDYMTEQSTAATSVHQGNSNPPSLQLFSPTSSTSSNSSISSSNANLFYSNSASNGFGYDLFADGHQKLASSLFPSDTASSFGISNNTDLNENELVPFFGSSTNFESSDLGIEDKSGQASNLNSSNLNQSFSNLFGLSASNGRSANANNLVSMLNGFL